MFQHLLFQGSKFVKVAAVIFVAALLMACGGGGRNAPTQTPFVITATSQPTPIALTVTPQPIVVTATPQPTVKVVTATPPPTSQPGPTTCPGAPTIEFFASDPVTILQGQATLLKWGKVLNATAVGIDQGVGGVPAPGQMQVSPPQTTTYTMVATGCGGQTQKSLTVSVVAPTAPPPPTNAPKPTDTPKPTDPPVPTATTAVACVSQIQGVQVSAPANPGNTVNVTATECYGGERGEGVVVIATALDDRQTPIPAATVPSANAGVNKTKTVNLTITRMLGATPVKSYQVQVCFQTAQGEKFGCVTEPFVMNWE